MYSPPICFANAYLVRRLREVGGLSNLVLLHESISKGCSTPGGRRGGGGHLDLSRAMNSPLASI
jgi:hypothetical protein